MNMNKKQIKSSIIISAIIIFSTLVFIAPTNARPDEPLTPSQYKKSISQSSSGTTIGRFGSTAVNQLDDLAGKIASKSSVFFNNALTTSSQSIIKSIADMSIFTLDEQLIPLMIELKNIATGQSNKQSSVSEKVEQKISDNFNNNDPLEFEQPTAEDDVPLPSKSTSASSIFSPTSQPTTTPDNTALNLSHMLETTTISDPKEQENILSALNYLDPTTSMKIVRLGTTMSITDPTTQSVTDVSTYEEDKDAKDSSQNNKKLTFQDLKDTLNRKAEYRDYKRFYRSVIITKTVPLDVIYDSYQQRIPLKNGKSLIALEDEQLERLSSDEYYRYINAAPTAVLLRENVATNIMILSELRKMRRESEKARLMSAITTLQTLSITSSQLAQAKSAIERLIYNWRYPTKAQDTEALPSVDSMMSPITGSDSSGSAAGAGTTSTSPIEIPNM